MPFLRRLPLLLGCLTLLAALPAGAVAVDGLYRARLDVVGKGEQARAEAFRAGLERVIVRVAGSSAVLQKPEIRKLLDAPAHFVQQYRYERIEDAAGSGTGDGAQQQAEEAAPTHHLVVTYAGTRIDRALRDRGVTVWDAQRPEVLAWVAVDDGRDRYILGADGDSRAHEVLRAAARERALPVILPLMDTEDRSRIQFVDISGGFLDAVREASRRYRAETLLVGHIQRRSGTWYGDWDLFGIGDRRSWRQSGSDLQAVVAGGVDGTTERLAAALAGRGGTHGTVRVKVEAVDSLEAYARVSRYLQQLVRVRSASVVSVRPGETVFQVKYKGHIGELERTIRLGETLRPVEHASAGESVLEPLLDNDAVGAAAAGDAPSGTDAPGPASEDAAGAASAPGAADTPATASAGAAPGAAGAAPATGDATPARPDQPAEPVDLVFRLVG